MASVSNPYESIQSVQYREKMEFIKNNLNVIKNTLQDDKHYSWDPTELTKVQQQYIDDIKTKHQNKVITFVIVSGTIIGLGAIISSIL